MENKIGVGIITCNRESFFHKCVDSVPSVDKLIVINDGKPYSSYGEAPDCVIEHDESKSVGVSKNEALKYLMDADCDHIFLIEDDVYIKDPEVFKKYIQTAEVSGIWHLSFGYHREWNSVDGKPEPMMVMQYGDVMLALNKNSVGAFVYFYRGVIKNIGYFDENYKNCLEHVDHTYKIIKAGLHPPFWWFADVADSYNYIEDIGTKDDSVIDKSSKTYANTIAGRDYFKSIHGCDVLGVPEQTQEEVYKALVEIRNKYARKVLS